MQTFVLTAFYCGEKPTWWQKKLGVVPGCTCSYAAMRKSQLCTVRAPDAQTAARLLDGKLTGMSSLPWAGWDIDNSTAHDFRPGKETYAKVAAAFRALKNFKGNRHPLATPLSAMIKQLPAQPPEAYMEELVETARYDRSARTANLLQAALGRKTPYKELYLIETPCVAEHQPASTVRESGIIKEC